MYSAERSALPLSPIIKVNSMNPKFLIPALLAAALSGCAATPTDPVRAKALADIQQARAEGSFPLTEGQFVYPKLVAARQVR
jgi:hypothetical protein